MLDHRKGILYSFGSVIAFSVVGPVSKMLMLAYPEMDIMWLVQVRMTITALFFVIYCLITDRKSLLITGKQFTAVISIGVFGLFGVQYGIFAAMQTITITVAVFIQDTSAIMVCLLSFVFLKEKFSTDKAIGLVFGMSGMIVIFYTPGALSQNIAIAGLVWAFLSAIAKVYYCFTMKLIRIPVITILAYGFSAGAILSWFFAPAQTIALIMTNITDSWFVGMVLCLSIIGTTFSFFLYMRSITLTYLSTVGLITVCIPVVTMVSSYFLLGETVSIKDGIGIALIFFGIVVMQVRSFFRERTKRKEITG